MKPTRVTVVATIVTFAVVALAAASSGGLSVSRAPRAQSDERALEIAELTMEAMGGEEAWNNTRYISWKFMGGRLHVWDKWTGNHRIEHETREGDHIVSLINVNTWNGRAFKNGVQVTDGDELVDLLNRAEGAWINDTYWMFMPYKLRDPGVALKYLGEKPLEDGRPADVLQLTFEEVGHTPQNKYEVFVGQDTGLVEQWTHWTSADDAEPRFTRPWAAWQRFGNIMLATDHGAGRDWSIHVYDSLPDSVFTDPEPAFSQ